MSHRIIEIENWYFVELFIQEKWIRVFASNNFKAIEEMILSL